jgi:hypothetical protein
MHDTIDWMSEAVSLLTERKWQRTYRASLLIELSVTRRIMDRRRRISCGASVVQNLSSMAFPTLCGLDYSVLRRGRVLSRNWSFASRCMLAIRVRGEEEEEESILLFLPLAIINHEVQAWTCMHSGQDADFECGRLM